MSEEYVELRVETARQRDVGKKIARISRRHMQTLGISYGDFIEVEGPKGSVILQVWPAYKEDEIKDTIRIDGYAREAIGAAVGEYVRVRKAKVERGNKVVLAPTVPLRFDESFVQYVKEQLLYKPVKRGEVVFVFFPLFGEPLRFVVVSTQPTQAVYIDEDTEVIVRSEPVREEAIARGIPKVTWEDIGDLEEVKERIREIIEIPMRHPELFKHLGIEPPKGVLLHGPPGVGKTLLAKALANEIGAYFIAINGPEIMSKFYGESEARLREIFEEAKKHAPSIIFIDEIDAIAPKRDEVIGEVERRVVAQLLALMDGLESRGDVIVIGATNRPHALDPALRRPGRFDREVEIGVPNREGRYEILQIHTRGMPLDKSVNLRKLAEITHGYTGADLKALCREAALNALRRILPRFSEGDRIPASVLERLKVTEEDFMNAYKEIIPTALREFYVEASNVRWSDVGGLKDVKKKLEDNVIKAIKRPELFQKLGIEPPKGVLLYGPPGCGKTLIAKALANESQASFLAINGPEIMSKYYGETEAKLREIFKQAKENAPSIIFIDEIDSIAPKREEVYGEVEKRVVAQLLSLMDGLTERGNVIVIGATNRIDDVDPALRRPGRFDREVEIGVPNREGRYEILQIHTRGMPLDKNVDLRKLAEITHGYTGADLKALCREAALNALRRILPRFTEGNKIPASVLERLKVTEEDFMNAYKEIVPTALREFYVEASNIRWSDVGGLKDVKKKLEDNVIKAIRHPELFQKLGIEPPKGVLLYGPPGCGKTLIAKALANESQASFLVVRGPEILSKWVGESEKAIREIFRKAKASAPSIILFDELDAIAKVRMGYTEGWSTEGILSQLLSEMDSLYTMEQVFVIGTTNRPDLLDPSLLRPGRFDLLIYVPPPSKEERLEILRIFTKRIPLDPKVSLEEIAAKTERFTGADLRSLCREAGLNAIRRGAERVGMTDFIEAFKYVRPSFTEDIEKWYEEIKMRLRNAVVKRYEKPYG